LAVIDYFYELFFEKQNYCFSINFLNIITICLIMDISQPISISNRALCEIEEIISEKHISDDYGLRVGLKGAGCGATYLLGFDLPVKADDVFLIENIKVIIDRKHLMFMIGLGIDFEEGEDGVGFVFLPKEINDVSVNALL
jgi:iron-sulfur cluster assembly protein